MVFRGQGLHDGHFQISAPAVSQHLKVLLEVNVVTMEKQAKQCIYRLNPVAISKVEEWTRKYRFDVEPQV
ncbi:ArsR/SmtB family transcription factor [Paenibacillus sp. Soil787]|uniref:ArsR/SmtB family transcription factor n=1 Tax=Paenibacillus sp. Soil787 TaxID=1736411 RepID=UPI0007036D10|nr:ArsR family transcriptional regulator [Paenibacillus sp. Soil787]KRF21713.1 hypothetical protein ASG93_30435 [Paenibacillus sp. Soil787]